MNSEKLKSAIESILFVSGESVSFSKLAKATKEDEEKIKEAVDELSGEYLSKERGVRIITKENRVQMVTNPDNSLFVDDLVKSELQESLSKASLEVLSIVAYRGPITRFNIDSIRGVNSSFILRNLLMRGLIERVGNPKDSRGYLYKISFDFLKKLGISDVRELPNFEALSKDERAQTMTESEEGAKKEDKDKKDNE